MLDDSTIHPYLLQHTQYHYFSDRPHIHITLGYKLYTYLISVSKILIPFKFNTFYTFMQLNKESSVLPQQEYISEDGIFLTFR